MFVAYINKDSPRFPKTVLKADFCLVNEPNYVARWKLQGDRVRALSLTFQSTDKAHMHRGEWDLLLRALSQVDYSEDTSNHVGKATLTELRDEFLQTFPTRATSKR